MSKDCGIKKIMDILGGKWKLQILWTICNNRGIRFNQLKRGVSGITNVMLTRSLGTLIEHDLVKRVDFHTIPPHVEYSLTSKGNELIPFMRSLDSWGRDNLD